MTPELLAALEPFLQVPLNYIEGAPDDEGVPDDMPIGFEGDRLTYGDFRRLRKAAAVVAEAESRA